jgi:hypothetical protein
MKPQQYSNHIRYYPPHHFVFYPVVILGLVISVRAIIKHPQDDLEWYMITALWVVIGWLAYMLRQHYALTVQNRIVRMEMRFRYYVLTQQRLEPLEQQLSFNQLAALRFASDNELAELTARTIREKLTPDQIKKEIKNWLQDEMRV